MPADQRSTEVERAAICRRGAELQQRESRTASDSGLPLMRTLFREMEQRLDRAQENTLLSTPEVPDMVMEAIQHRVGINRWKVFESVVMPNHIHLSLSVLQRTLKELIEDFKRWTCRGVSRLEIRWRKYVGWNQ